MAFAPIALVPQSTTPDGCTSQRWRAALWSDNAVARLQRPGSAPVARMWAAAGTWHDVFGIEPHKLVEASGGAVTDLKRS